LKWLCQWVPAWFTTPACGRPGALDGGGVFVIDLGVRDNGVTLRSLPCRSCVFDALSLAKDEKAFILEMLLDCDPDGVFLAFGGGVMKEVLA
jgi:hypothetical protein